MLRLLRHLVILFSLAVVFGLARDARADAATAQALFDQAKKLMAEKKYAEACPKFEESQRQDPGLGTQTNLAICYEAMGRTASAWTLYNEVASQAKATGQAEREKKAREAVKALEPKLSKLTIEVESPVDGIEVRRNGQLVNQTTWGLAVPVDPGEIKVTAMAPNRKLWETSVTIDKPGDTTVKVPELEKGKTPAGYGGSTPAPTVTGYNPGYYGSQPPPVLPPRMKRRSPGMFGGGIAMISLGSLGVVVGGIWLALAAGANEFGGDNNLAAPGAVTLIGAGLLGGGIALTVIGGKKVPVEPGDASSPKVRVASPVPEVKLGVGHLSADWVF